MRLILSIEGQRCSENGLAQILSDTIKKLDFLTNKTDNLENDNKYGSEFREIAIIPSCMNEEFWETTGWKERKRIWHKKKEADIRLRMDYDRFINETIENKRLLFIDVIVRSIQVVQAYSKEDFSGYELIKDILSALNVTAAELKQFVESTGQGDGDARGA